MNSTGRMSIRQAILKATDAKLRADNWQYILEVCDRVSEDPEDGGEEAVEVIEQRLGQKDANVVLRTLSLIISLAENCGSRLKQAIDSKKFTKLLLSLIENRSVHNEVKKEIVKTVQQLSQSFNDDPSLRYMSDLLRQITKSYPMLLNDQQPSVPSKKEMTLDSKQKEEKELEEALKLSLVEFENQKNTQHSPAAQQQQQDEPRQQNAARQQGQVEGLAAPALVKKVRAMYDLSGTEPDELSFSKGDVIIVLEQVYRDWWRGTLRGKVGIFPLNYVMPIEEQSPQELRMEIEKENKIMGQKANVDQLYFTLKSAKSGNNENLGDPTQNPAINDLYGSVTPLRPEVAKMIGKYARKREDLVSLRQVLANAEVTYNQLLDRATNAYTSPIPMAQSQPFDARVQEHHSYQTQPSENGNNTLQQMQQTRQQDLYPMPQAQLPQPPQYGANYAQTHTQFQAPSYTSRTEY